MPVLERAMRHQIAVLWAVAGTDNYGNATVYSPVEVQVRWNENQQLQAESQSESEKDSGEVVVDRDIEVGSLMRLGTLADISGDSSPDGLCRVTSFRGTPDVKGRRSERIVSLSRYKGTLPTIVS